MYPYLVSTVATLMRYDLSEVLIWIGSLSPFTFLLSHPKSELSTAGQRAPINKAGSLSSTAPWDINTPQHKGRACFLLLPGLLSLYTHDLQS